MFKVVCWRIVVWGKGFPFPHTANLQQTTENVYSKICKISIIVGIITEKKLVLSNFSICHTFFKSRTLQMRLHASLGGKGLLLLPSNMHLYKFIIILFLYENVFPPFQLTQYWWLVWLKVLSFSFDWIISGFLLKQ